MELTNSPESKTGISPYLGLGKTKKLNLSALFYPLGKRADRRILLMLKEEQRELEDDILMNIGLYLDTQEEKYHGLAVMSLKKRFNLTGAAANKVFWVIRNNLAKKLNGKGEEA